LEDALAWENRPENETKMFGIFIHPDWLALENKFGRDVTWKSRLELGKAHVIQQLLPKTKPPAPVPPSVEPSPKGSPEKQD
jgi:hypothetical protein